MEILSRRAIVTAARDWIGTPYRHQASVRGAGCDCLGLVRGVWRELCGLEPESTPPYSPDWAEVSGLETLRDAARRHLVERAIDAALPGDVLLFRMTPESPAKHCAILSDDGLLIHAYWGRAVVESRYASWWRSRVAYVFSFPGVGSWPS